MANNIRLHKEHGLNPTMPQCFWCGKDTGEIALLGAAYKGQAPMHMVMDYNPCKECATQMSQGITFIEMVPATKERPALSNGMAPSGRLITLTEEAVRCFLKEPMLTQVLEIRKAYLESTTFEHLFGEQLVEKKYDHD